MGLFGGRDGDFILSALFLSEIYELLLEKAMAPHSSTPAWRIPWMEEAW